MASHPNIRFHPAIDRRHRKADLHPAIDPVFGTSKTIGGFHLEKRVCHLENRVRCVLRIVMLAYNRIIDPCPPPASR